MIREQILKEFPTWDPEKQLKEYQAYKALGDFSPFTEMDYKLMEIIMKNSNIEIEVECENGVCHIVNNTLKEINTINENKKLEEARTLKIKDEQLELVSLLFDILFNDKDEEEPEKNSEDNLKFSKYLKTLLNKLKDKADRRKNNQQKDLLFSPLFKEKSKEKLNIPQQIYDKLGGKQEKLKFDKNSLYLKKLLNLSNIVSVKEILDYPIIRIMMFALLYDNKRPSQIIEMTYKNIDNEENENIKDDVLKIRKLPQLVEYVRKNIRAIKYRRDNPEIEELRKTSLTKLKNKLKQKKKELAEIEQQKNSSSDLNKLNQLKSRLEAEIEFIQNTIDNFDENFDNLDLFSKKSSSSTSSKKSSSSTSSKKSSSSTSSKSSTATSSSSFEKEIKKILSDSYNDFSNLKEEVNKDLGDDVIFNEKQIKILNQVLNGSYRFYNNLQDQEKSKKLYNKIIQLFNKEGKGFGKGELFFNAIINGAEIQGGSESFDILINDKHKYEVKAYDLTSTGTLESNGIRLGKEGKVQGFSVFYELVDLIKEIQELFSENDQKISLFDIFNKMADATNNKNFKKLTDLLYDSTDDNKTLLNILRSGEITPNAFIKINDALKLTAKVLQSIKENDFHYARLFGKNKDEIYAIEDLNIQNKNNNYYFLNIKAKKVDLDVQQKAIEKIDKLLKMKFIKTDNYLFNVISEIMIEINKRMKEHPMILVGNKEPIIHGKYTDFVFVKITQGIVRIAPREIAPLAAQKLIAILNL